LRQQIISVGEKLLDGFGFFDAYAIARRELTGSQVAILMYHRVAPKANNWSLDTLPPKDFERQISYFAKRYKIISLESLVQTMQNGEHLPKKAIIVTFDDGYRDNYTFAYPILKKYGIPATLFVTSGHIGTDKLFWWDKVGYIIEHCSNKVLNLCESSSYSLRSSAEKFRARNHILELLKRTEENRKTFLIEKLVVSSGVVIPNGLARNMLLSWDEIKEMSDNGITIGSHTVNHPILNNITLERAHWEISKSKDDIQEALHKEVLFFSYPNGDFNQEHVNYLIKTGFVGAVTILPSNLINKNDDVFKLSRVAISNNEIAFKMELSGFYHDSLGLLKRIKIRKG
jgi:peptidoglycan/xylan/chitin deacetylase (PgdA/CDA1 family)